MRQDEIAQVLEDRAQTYLFFSHVFFKELTSEVIDELAREEFPQDTGNENLNAGYKMLERYFAFRASDARLQLANEYARIFLGAGVYGTDKSIAAPYESVFEGELGIMMEGPRDEVRSYFAQDGFVVNPELKEPDDHIAFEFEYLSSMNERALELLDAGDVMAVAANVKRQHSFCEQHILNWLPKLNARAQEYAKTTFYLGLMLVAQGYVEVQQQLVDDIVGSLSAA